MANEALEDTKYATKNESRLEGEADSLIAYKPKNVSVELEVESYTAMRYHGQ